MIAVTATQWLWYLNIAADALLIACLLREKLFKLYPIFFAYFLVDEGVSLVRLFWWGSRWHQDIFYAIGHSVLLLLMAWGVREVLGVVFEDYPGLAGFLQKNGGHLVGISALVALLLTPLDPSLPWQRVYLSQHFSTFARGIYSGLIAYLVLVSALIVWLRVSVRFNVALYLGGFMAFFASHWVAMLLFNNARRSSEWVNVGMLFVSLSCVICWTVAVGIRFDQRVPVLSRGWNPTVLGQLSGQLKRINASLLRFGGSEHE